MSVIPFQSLRRHIRSTFLCTLLICLSSATNCLHAGLSGENVALIVNADSADSLTIANHYVSLRNIPAMNVILLENVPSELTISLDRFRDSILKPILETINARGLAPQIHVVTYSAGFPTSVDISAHTKRLTDPAQAKYQTPTASINSLTYFYRWVLSDSPDYLGWGSNFYARGAFDRHFANPFAGEKGQQFEAAVTAASEDEFAEAAEIFETLANEYPTIHPLRIRAAENWLRSGDESKSLEQIRQAASHGWTNARYLRETEPLSQMFADDVELTASRRRFLEQLQDIPKTQQEPLGFSSSVGWTMCGHPVPIDQGAMPYMLSCVLAVIHENGSTFEQAVEVLRRGAAADRTYPSATFGFSKTSDVRSTTRLGGLPDALAWLLCRKQNVEIFSSVLPSKPQAYVGMMLGSAELACSQREWAFAPGAIAENLTSLGAVFQTTSQTKMTELLHAGAAISSGAVAEPYALAPKFPSAMLYPYYCEGVTAIEAFYLSIPSPYQMLIVGDPLCQPFAQAPNDFVRIERDNSDQETPAIKIGWQPIPDTAHTSPTSAIEIYVQGKLAARVRPMANIDIRLPGSTTGVVDVRAVLLGANATEPRISKHEEVFIGSTDENRLPRIEQYRKDNSDLLTLFAECDGADRLEVMHFGRVIHTAKKSTDRFTLNADQIGRGPVRLQVVAHQADAVILGGSVEMMW
jgi:hypothetical protein